MNTITTGYSVSKANTPAFKGYVDKSVYKYARKLVKSAVRNLGRGLTNDNYKSCAAPGQISVSLKIMDLLKKLEEKAISLSENTVICITKEPIVDSGIVPPRKGFFLSIRNPGFSIWGIIFKFSL